MKALIHRLRAIFGSGRSDANLDAEIRQHLDHLADIGSTHLGDGFGTSSYPNYVDLRERAKTLSGVYAQNLLPRAMSMTSGSGPSAEQIFAVFVTNNYFNVLGVRPASGRLFD